MSGITITNAKIITPQGIKRGELYIEGKKIAKNKKSGALKINAKGLFVSPGFIDLHIHGDPVKISKREARFGTTSFLCGIRETKPKRIRALLKQLEQANEKTGAKALGFYLEGPYVNPNMRGALLRNWVKKPILNELKETIKAAQGKMKVITVAPEVKGMTGLIKYMKEKNIIPSIGHTDATYKQALDGIDAGASLATHTFNRMRLIDQREPAASGAVLLDKRVAAEVMLDNIHVHPALLKLLILCKTDDKIVFVTDSVASGPISGTRKCGKVYKTKEGAFAGGSLTMNQAVKNGAKAGARIEQAVKMASLNPARVLRIDKKKGSLEPGKDADVVIFDGKFDVKLTMVEGKVVFKKICAE